MTDLSRITEALPDPSRTMTAVLLGDVRETLKQIPDDSIQCCVTSPPYFNLRDYNVAGQIGLEASPEAYVAEMVAVFREVRRVLHPSGVAFVNLGDSYAGGGYSNHKINGADWFERADLDKRSDRQQKLKKAAASEGIKPKDLLMIPARVALALQADGWWIRSQIAWTKNNPMPESTKDRPTSSWESIFMLTKSNRYFWDYEGSKEPAVGQNAHDLTGGKYAPPGQSPHSGSRKPRKGSGNGFKRDARLSYQDENGARGDDTPWEYDGSGTRNMRNVWQINTKPCKEAHFATFPIELPTRCIKAATSEAGRCPTCSSPWKRIVEKGEPDLAHMAACGADASGGYEGQAVKDYAAGGAQNASDVKRRILEGMRKKTTVGWAPTCKCPPHVPVPCICLDPFGGAGTTAMAANALGQDAVLCELNPAYIDITKKRLGKDVYDFFIWDLL